MVAWVRLRSDGAPCTQLQWHIRIDASTRDEKTKIDTAVVGYASQRMTDRVVSIAT
jgi:hypothetical protein